MAIQDKFIEPARGVHARMTAPVALMIGAIAAAVLVWAAQGTDAARGGPVWHGNSGPLALDTVL